jgi:hypothetical protein
MALEGREGQVSCFSTHTFSPATPTPNACRAPRTGDVDARPPRSTPPRSLDFEVPEGRSPRVPMNQSSRMRRFPLASRQSVRTAEVRDQLNVRADPVADQEIPEVADGHDLGARACGGHERGRLNLWPTHEVPFPGGHLRRLSRAPTRETIGRVPDSRVRDEGAVDQETRRNRGLRSHGSPTA